MKTQILICLLGIALAQSATTKKKSTEETTPTPSPSDDPTPGPAILAIEIVDSKDSNDTSTEARNNTKRTIESALGYGFQGNYYPTSQSKKYMIYPYSQRDIPAASIKDANSKYLSSQTLNIQKSVSYNLGTKIEPAAQTKQLFAPSQVYSEPSGDGGNYPSTLYSTVGQGGIIGGLSTNVPQHASAAAATTIPVIILRVYTNQLSDPSAIYPNLPQTHPYANNLNNINLQSIISNYLQQQMYQAQQMYKQPVYQSPSVAYQGQGQNLIYSSQNPSYALMYSTQGSYPSQSSYSSQESYPTQQPQIDYKSLEHATALPTHENYPSNAHTRVVYHGPKGHIQGVSYSGGTTGQSYGVPQQSQSYSQPSYSQSQASYAPNSQYVYSTQGQDYASNSQSAYTDSQGQSYAANSQSAYPDSQGQSYAANSQSAYPDSQGQSYATNSQQVYTDSQGQSYIYVDPSQLQQGQGYYQQDYQQQEYQPQQEYQQQQYQQQEYQQVYQKPQEDRKYLPVPQSNPEKVYNYHAESGKDRSKKSSGGPVTFESKKVEPKRKAS